MSIYSQILEWEVLLLEQQKEYEEVSTKDKSFGIIYRVTNLINGKVYIGQTRQGLSIRKAHHIRDHNNKSHESIVLYKAFRKYGLESFKWEAIDTAADVAELNNKEIEWIAIHEANKGKGYNMTAGGQGVKNYKVTEEGVQRRVSVLNRMWANGHAETMLSGENHPRASLTNAQVREAVELLIREDITDEYVSVNLGLKRHFISSLKTGESFKNIITDEERNLMKARKIGQTKRMRDFTESEVLEMKNLLLNSDMKTGDIYKMFDIHKDKMKYLVDNSKWKYLFTEEEVVLMRTRKGRDKIRKLTAEEVKEIKEMIQEDLYTLTEIAMIFNCRPKQIQGIANGDRWSSVLIDLSMEDIEIYDWKPIVGIIKNKTRKSKS